VQTPQAIVSVPSVFTLNRPGTPHPLADLAISFSSYLHRIQIFDRLICYFFGVNI
jgi:hypothetical protein